MRYSRTANTKSGKPWSAARRKHIKTILWFAAAFLALVALGVSLLLYDVYVGFGAPARPSFVGYRPLVLPDDIQVVGQSLTRQHMPSMDIWNFYYSLKLTSRDVSIFESQKNQAEPNTVSCRGYGGYCSIYHTTKGYTYRVWYSTDSTGKPFDMTVDWTKGNTDVNISVADSVAAKYLTYNWGTVINSMQPVNLSQMHYTKYTSCGCGG